MQVGLRAAYPNRPGCPREPQDTDTPNRMRPRLGCRGRPGVNTSEFKAPTSVGARADS